MVALLRGDRYSEAHDVNPAPNSLIGALDFGQLVGGQPQLKLRCELKEFTMQEASCYTITAGQLLDLSFCKALACLRLYGGYLMRRLAPVSFVAGAECPT